MSPNSVDFGSCSLSVEQRLSTAAFGALEKEFRAVVARLKDDMSMENHRVGYERLFKFLKQSLYNEKALVLKYQDLHHHASSLSSKLTVAGALEVEQQNSIKSLKCSDRKLRESLSQLEGAKQRESRSIQKTDNLRKELAHLERQIKEAERRFSLQRDEISRVTGVKVGLEKHIGIVLGKNRKLEEKVRSKELSVKERKSEIERLKGTISSMTKTLANCCTAIKEETRHRKETESVAEDLQRRLDENNRLLEEIDKECTHATKDSTIPPRKATTTSNKKTFNISHIFQGHDEPSRAKDDRAILGLAYIAREVNSLRSQLHVTEKENEKLIEDKQQLQEYVRAGIDSAEKMRDVNQRSQSENEVFYKNLQFERKELESIKARSLSMKGKVDEVAGENVQYKVLREEYEANTKQLQGVIFRLQEAIVTVHCEELLTKENNGGETTSRLMVEEQQGLSREQSRVIALTDELNPQLNVLRLRQLAENYNSKCEAIQKVQILQKRLMKKADQLFRKNIKVREQAKTISDLKKALSCQPRPKKLERFSDFKRLATVKNRQMRSMAGELNMHQVQVFEYKREIHCLNAKLLDIKRKYFKQQGKIAGMAYKQTLIERTDTTTVISEDSEKDEIESLPPDCRSQVVARNHSIGLLYVGGTLAITNNNK